MKLVFGNRLKKKQRVTHIEPISGLGHICSNKLKILINFDVQLVQ